MELLSKYLKKMSATTQILLSFIVVIIIGTFLLSLPISNKQYSIGFLNNLLAEVYTLFGQIVVLIMIQIGGLGFITLFMFFLTSLSSKMSMRGKSLISESLSIESNFNITKMIRVILLYTLIFEGVGASLLAIRFIPEYGFTDGLFKAIFISMSAFCNAGFDTLGSNSLMKYVNDPLVNLTLIALITLGGIGFTVWFEVGKQIKALYKKEISLKKAINKTNLHTRVVIIFSFVLLVLGTLLTLVFE